MLAYYILLGKRAILFLRGLLKETTNRLQTYYKLIEYNLGAKYKELLATTKIQVNIRKDIDLIIYNQAIVDIRKIAKQVYDRDNFNRSLGSKVYIVRHIERTFTSSVKKIYRQFKNISIKLLREAKGNRGQVVAPSINQTYSASKGGSKSTSINAYAIVLLDDDNNIKVNNIELYNEQDSNCQNCGSKGHLGKDYSQIQQFKDAGQFY